MLRKRVFTPFLFLSLLLVGAFTAVGQTAAIGGTVEIEKADGTVVPAENAKLDCYRTDAELSCRSTTTNSRGEFTFIGIPYNGTVALAVSGPGIAPMVYPGVKAGQDKLTIRVREGDGSVIDEAEARQLAAAWAANPTGELTEEQKKAQAEYEKKVAEVQAKNEQVKKKNETWDRVLKEGNEAYNSGNYDIAIVKFQEGIDVDPDYIGSAPAFYNNKGAALKKRAVEVYNAGVKSGNATQLREAKQKALSDLSSALKAYGNSLELLTSAPTEEIADPVNQKLNLFNAADGGRDAVRLMVLIESIDPEQTETAKKLIEEYVKAESDKKKQGEALASLASYLFSGGDFDGSVAAYRKAYEFAPKDPEVLGKYSLALYTAWELNQDDALQNETVKLLEEYLANAPKDHKYRDDLGCLANGLLKKKKYPCSQDQ